MKKLIYFSILTVASVCVILIFIAPYLMYTKNKFGFLIYFIFSPLCHQIPERSFHLFGFPLAVCSRCTGIYLGLLIGTIIYPLFRNLENTTLPSPKIFILISLPMGIDAFGNIINLWISPNFVRSATGIIWGIILPFYLIPGIVDLLRIIPKPKVYMTKLKNGN